MGTLEPLYSNTVIGTLAVDGWAVTFGTASGAAPPIPFIAAPIVTAHPSTASILAAAAAASACSRVYLP